MGWLAGVLSGYNDRHTEIRKENAQLAEEAAQREAAVYQQLLNSDDPKLQHMAATGILQMGQGRKGKSGFAGWMGEMQSSPIYPIVQKYMQTPQRTETVTPGLPSAQLQGGAVLPSGGQSGHQSEQWEVGKVPASATQVPRNQQTNPDGSLAYPDAALAQPAASPTTGGSMTTPVAAPGAAADIAAPAPAPAPPPAPPPRPPATLGAQTPAAPAWSVLHAPPAATSARRGAPPQAGPPPAPPASVAAAAPVAAAPPAPPEPAAEPVAEADPRAVAQDDASGALSFAEDPVAVTPPPTPPVFSSRQVAGPDVGRTDVSVYQPHFPTHAELLAQDAKAKVQAEIQGLQEAFKAQGDPDWQKKGLATYLAEHARATPGVAEGDSQPVSGALAKQLGVADGTYMQPLYDKQTGNLIRWIPSAAGGRGATRALTKREEIAAMKFGDPSGNEDPVALNRRLTPAQRQAVFREEMTQAAETKLRAAEAMANAPLTAQAKSELTEHLAADWRAVQKPQLAMQQALGKMNIGVARYNDDRIGASQAVLVTFQQLLDPTSVVRESEYARSASGLSLVDRAQGLWDKYGIYVDPQTGRWIGGGAGVPEQDLKAMAETARQFLAEMVNFNDGEKDRISFRAQQHNIDPRAVFGNTVAAPPAIGTQPAPATPRSTAAPTRGPLTPAETGGHLMTMSPDGTLLQDGKPY